jgi:hypothetical protein
MTYTVHDVYCASADGIPILVRVIKHKNFTPGPFNLGRWHLPINLAAVFWVVISSVRINR